MNKRAFSLIEISIVIVIIGILISGIVASSLMIKSSRMATVNSITQASPVAEMDGATMWIESTLASGFLDTEFEDQKTLSNWYDNNSQRYEHVNFTQATTASKPLYTISTVNFLPAVKFDGSNDYMQSSISASPFQSPNFTLIALVQTPTNATSDFISTKNSSSGFSLGKTSSDNISFQDYSAGTTFNFSYTFDGKPQIISLMYTKNSSNNIATLYNNGVLLGTSSQAGANSSNSTIYLGSKDGSSAFWNGYIAEVIIFNRILKQDERQKIEYYLSQKYSISL